MKIKDEYWFLIISILVLVLVPIPAHAVKTMSGNEVTISSPIDDDVFVSGGTVNVNSPVSSLVVAGGNVNINAPVSGDVFATGGQIFINSNVGGKIVAIGGKIDLAGSAKNVVLYGGTVHIHPSAVISRDALVGGNEVNNAGTITGNLTVMTQNFVNTGSAGNVNLKKDNMFQEVKQAATIAEAVIVVGFFILGLILIKYFTPQFMQVQDRVKKSLVKTTAIGFVSIIVASVIILLIAVTIVGLPIAAILGMLFIISLMLSTLFVAFSFGQKIVDKLHFKTNKYGIFIVGFVILNLLFKIPSIGPVILVIVVSLGMGAIYYTLREKWKSTLPQAT